MEASASVIVFTLHDIPARAERGLSAGLAWDKRGNSVGFNLFRDRAFERTI